MSHVGGPGVTPQLRDPEAERVRRSLELRLREIGNLPAMGLHAIRDVELADGVATVIAHGLGHSPEWAAPSAVRGAVTIGMIEEIRDGSYDRASAIMLRATGYGATITVDVAVF